MTDQPLPPDPPNLPVASPGDAAMVTVQIGDWATLGAEASAIALQGALKDAVEAGTTLGFVSREPAAAKRKPGPKRTEAQDKVSIPGPKRVIDQFRTFCTEQNVTLWEGLDLLLQGRER